MQHNPLTVKIESQRTRRWVGLYGSSVSIALSQGTVGGNALSLVVARSSHEAQSIYRDLKLLGRSECPVVYLPDRETLPYDPYSAHPDIASERLTALNRISSLHHGIVIVSATTLLQRLPPRSFVLGRSFRLVTGDNLDLDGFRARLLEAGYETAEQVYQSGQFAIRGSVVDVFASGSDCPLRIDLFDEEIESIRLFDAESQRSSEQIQAVQMMPAREYPSDVSALDSFRKSFRYRFAVDMRSVPLYQDLRAGLHPQGLEHYLPLFYDSLETLTDYMAQRPVLVLQDGAAASLEQFQAQTAERWEQRRHDLERPILEPSELFIDPAQVLKQWESWPRIRLGNDDSEQLEVVAFGCSQPPSLDLSERNHHGGEELQQLVQEFPGRILFCADTAGRREFLAETLRSFQVRFELYPGWQEFLNDDAQVGLSVLPIEEGFSISDEFAVLTEAQLFKGRARNLVQRSARGRDPESIIRDLSDLSAGAPVVHEDHGVGRYRGLEVLEIDGRPAEFLMLEYADADKLYVPVSSLHLVSRHTGTSPEQAPLHRLGGDQWEKAKRRARERVRDVAAELLDLYARRQARKGFSFSLDHKLYVEFSAGFPFEETPDQQRAIEAVVSDMISDQPMDRVVCGDVGFGKTEVALRAAFLAVQGGRQVALLVPTTLLAQQHHATFSDRFADWPVRIELMSRFRSAKQSSQVLDALREGAVDIVIGTHRLLQKDIRFEKLGLVIVDEEQRFGVRQKERLKQLRSEVDLLTLTATPIPRTLNMAMSGIRDLSIIATPPARRMAVKTLVTQWDRSLLREALQRELQRGGQVFFLHNEVRSIERIARDVEELVPEGRVQIAHGQMPERELEQVMLDFYRQRFNVLVCTTIIESGIDVPTANTIIVNRADRFGLAQLHQLRGRVGRSHHRAYAYLVVPEERAMSRDARKRLEAITSLEELGAGFTLATHDMEIRGAGELLGEGQSGQIQQIGFSLYSEYLQRAVDALRDGREPINHDLLQRGADIELHLPALIPEDYLPDIHARLTLYKRIASAADDAGLRELQVEMIDRFGLLPEATGNLFELARARRVAERIGILKIDLGDRGGRIEFSDHATANPDGLLRLVREQPERYQLDGPRKLRIFLLKSNAQERIELLKSLLDQLVGQKP